MPDKNWQFELEEYIRQGEPDRAEKSEAWQTAIGLQAVDGLKTSEYLLDTAKDHIEGKITIDEAQKRIHRYYEQRSTHTETENETKEADIVSARITKLLGEKAFQFSPAEWITVHRRLFEGIFDHLWHLVRNAGVDASLNLLERLCYESVGFRSVEHGCIELAGMINHVGGVKKSRIVKIGLVDIVSKSQQVVGI